MRRLPAAAAVILVATIAVRAQQGPPQGGGAAARPLVPAAASSIAQSPETFYGENVSMSAAVEAVLSKTTFTVDQNKMTSTGKDVAVTARPGQWQAISTVLNGEVHRSNTIANMAFSPAFLVSFHSKVMPLYPGDIISPGTPGAVHITPGDTAESRIPGVGVLTNPVTAGR